MTTYTIIFPHASGTPISVTHPRYLGDGVTLIHAYRASLPSVLRLIRLASNKPMLVPHPTGCALEVIVKP